MKNILLVMGAILMLVLTGCGPTEEVGGIDLSKPFIGGTVGLNTYFLAGLPPAVVHDNKQFPFSVAVVLENLGETDIIASSDSSDVGYLKVRLEGINPSQWGNSTGVDQQQGGLIEKGLDVNLRGARKNFDGSILPGEITTVAFEGMNYQDNIRGNVEYMLRASICYDYKTLTSTLLCIKDDVLEHIQDDSICSLTGEKFPQNSGAPVQITSLIQLPLSQNKIQVNFVIEHVGTGEFYGIPGEDEDEETCDPRINNFNKHWVNVLVQPLSDKRLDIKCPRFGGSSQGDTKLYQGAPQTISCIIERDKDSAGRIYQDILEIELTYRYGQFIETPILVQDVSNEPIANVGPSP